MNDFRADLHCHSTCSDGSMTPMELLERAKQIGLSALSITDHDSISAYTDDLVLNPDLGLELLPGIELSSSLNDVSIHILGYGFQPNHQELISFCQRHAERRERRNRAILSELKKHGVLITPEELIPPTASPNPIIGRPHIAMAMLKKGYVKSFQEAFKKYLAEGRLCYVHGTIFSIEETLEVIHRAKGLAVIAHPHLLPNQKILNALLKMNFDGIECYYGNFNLDQHQPWLDIAKKKDWLITGGSDFHGVHKPMIDLGCSWIGLSPFQAIKERLTKPIS